MTDKKAKIYKVAKQVFSEYGFKNASVSLIMKKAGMAVGTFYNYFESKDKLFLEIFSQENITLKKTLLSEIDINGSPRVVILKLLRRNEEEMHTNPILNQWNNKETYHIIERMYNQEKSLDRMDFLYDFFLDVIINWQIQERIRKDIDPKLIMAMFNSLLYIESHKENIGIEFFPMLINYLTDFVIRGLEK